MLSCWRPKVLRVLAHYGLGIFAVLLAALGRIWLTPLLGDRFPFITFFVAIALTAQALSPGSSVVVLLSGAVFAEYCLVPPFNTLKFPSEVDSVVLGLYTLSGFTIIAFAQMFRRRQHELEGEIRDRQRAEEALRECEAEFRAAFEISAVGKAQADPHTGRFLRVNTKLCAITGYGADELHRMTFFDLTHPEDREERRRALDAFAAGGRGEYTVETRCVRKDGAVIWVAVDATIVRDATGRPLRTMAVIQDINDRKQAEAERRVLLSREQAARAHAEAANRAKDEFLALVSHELRTPLASMLTWARLLRQGTLDPTTTAEALESMERSTKLQAKLIDDILDVSRIITGKLQLEVRPLDLASVIAASIETVRSAADAKHTRIESAIDPNAGPILGDPVRLQQVAWNLLSNAIKFTPDGGRVEVSLTRVNSHVQIAVTDTGKGISGAFLPHIFERFNQADMSTTRAYGGLGLGLAIVRHLVELHGGSVHAASSGENQGARFTVSLPVIAVNGQIIAQERVHPVGNAGSLGAAPLLSGTRVLFVDDDGDTLHALALALNGHEAEVRAVPSAEAALEVLQTWWPDVLISDIGMPDSDGYALIGRVRDLGHDRGCQIPAIALTAYAGMEDRVKALASGFQMHVHKPIDPQELVTVIASLSRASTGRA